MIAKRWLLIIFISSLVFFSAKSASALLSSDNSSAAGQLERTQNKVKNQITNLQNKNSFASEEGGLGLKKRVETRETIKETVAKKREEAKEKFKLKRDEFKAKLEQIKDDRKKVIVERIDTRLATVNKNRTDHMSTVLDKLTSIVDRVSERIATAKANGKDVAGVEAAIATARTAIAAAQAAVSAQAGKEYVITIGEETALKGVVGKTTSQLQSDLQTVHKLVVEAKQAVQNIFREIKNTVSANKNATISITPPVASATAATAQ